MSTTTTAAPAVTRAGLRIALVNLAPWVLTALLTYLMVRLTVSVAVEYGYLGLDSHAYWLTYHVDQLYRSGPATVDGYLYSPAFAQLTTPVTFLPWPVFAVIWGLLETAALLWLLRPLPVRWIIPLTLACIPELVINGNVHVFLALMVAFGVRYPGVWAFGVLTKIIPGVGLVWFAARGEWRKLAIGVGVTAAVVAVSFALAPADWYAWVNFLLTNSGGGDSVVNGRLGLAIRAGLAAVLTVVAARTNRPWLLAPAVFVACPVMNSMSTIAILAAIPRLRAAVRS